MSVSDIIDTCDQSHIPDGFNNMHQLTFGNYVYILENPKNWDKLGLGMDRKTFCTELSHVNRIRNEVMHFSPDQIKAEDLKRLHDVSRMFETLRATGAF